MDYAIGIDIGSTCAKTAVLAADGSFALLSARPTGWSSVDTAESIRRGALPGPSARRSPRAGFPDNKETRSDMHGALSSRNI